MGTEDKWAWVKIGDPFPEHPVRAKGDPNQFVALWYKDGRPFFGRAWNNGGFVECSFPHKGVELKGKDQLGGQIQVLVHTGDYEKNGYWYDWVKVREWRQDHLKLVHCGNGAPILAPKPSGGDPLLGNIFIYEESASLSYNGKASDLSQQDLANALVPVRNFQPPLGVNKPVVKKEEGLGQKVVELGGNTGQELFQDIRAGDQWPAHTVSRSLRTKPGRADEEEFGVGLWYKDHSPVLGSCWEDKDGKIRASFITNGRELNCTGSFQVLRHHNAKSHGFEYLWTPWAQLKQVQASGGGWAPVIINGTAPCIVTDEAGGEHMGKLEVKSEKAAYATAAKECNLNAATCPPNSCLVLARRDFKGEILSVTPKEASFRAPIASTEPHLSPSMEYSFHDLSNLGPKRLSVKVKCSDTRIYRVRPVFLFLEPGKKVKLTIGRELSQAAKKDKLVLCYIQAHPYAKQPADEWEGDAEMRADGQVNMWLCKVGVPKGRAPSPWPPPSWSLSPSQRQRRRPSQRPRLKPRLRRTPLLSANTFWWSVPSSTSSTSRTPTALPPPTSLPKPRPPRTRPTRPPTPATRKPPPFPLPIFYFFPHFFFVFGFKCHFILSICVHVLSIPE